MSSPPKVLIVDDDPDFAGQVRVSLEQAGFEVDVAHDGDQGLAAVQAHPPDAIVLDVLMPGKDGYEVCNELKADQKYAHIPIVLLTTVDSQVTSARYSHADGMSTDADDYLTKPAAADDITASVQMLLAR